MHSTVETTRLERPQPIDHSRAATGAPLQLVLAALLVLVLLAAPRSRVVFGAPIYFIDVLAFLVLILPMHGKMYRWAPRIPISGVVPFYLAAVLISEARGMLEYGTPMESVYMMARYTLGISIFFTIPRLVSRPEHINVILKGLVIGTLVSSVVVILYSLGPTRSLVVNALFTKTFLNPGWWKLIEKIAIFGAGEAAMRGRSLIGAATMTAGFLSMTWPLAFILFWRLKSEWLWKNIALATIILGPIAVLMTYGRGAWVMTGVVILLIGVFGLASGRRILLVVVAGIAFAATQLDIDRDLFFFEHIEKKSTVAIENPFDDASILERLLSFVQPFGHVAENPSWIIAGAGRTGGRLARTGSLEDQLYDEGGLATHSGFAMAYYTFGTMAAICQVLFIILGFKFILARVRTVPRQDRDEAVVWQALLMCWCCYTLWWGSGHGMVGEPRGVMLSFLLMGLLVTFEKLRLFRQAGVR